MLREPHLADAPLIVGDADQPKHALDCSTEAAALGVRPGMTVRQALGICPQATIVPPDPVLYRSLWEKALASLEDVSPELEDAGLGQAYVNVSGLGPHYRDEDALGARIIEAVRSASGLVASVGLADGKFTARAAGSTAAPGETRALLPGSEAAFLAPLDVGLLPVELDVISRLHLFGLDSIGEVAGFSVPELQSQFGFEGKRLWQLVNGNDTEPLHPRRRTEALEAAVAFEAPVAGIDILVATAKQLLSRLRSPLRGRPARELTLQAELTSGRGWERRLVFREAVSENDRLIFLLRSALTNFPPPQAVRSLSLRLSGIAGESGKQLSLGERGRLQRQIEECLQQLKARYGFSPVFRCVDVEPWSVIPEERQILVESDA